MNKKCAYNRKLDCVLGCAAYAITDTGETDLIIKCGRGNFWMANLKRDVVRGSKAP